MLSLALSARLLVENPLRRKSGESENDAGIAQDGIRPKNVCRFLQCFKILCAHLDVDLHRTFAVGLHPAFIVTSVLFSGNDTVSTVRTTSTVLEQLMQAPETSTQLTQVPPQPTCAQIFNTGTCADLWKNYRQALAQRQREEAQLYINRQKELASAEATAPLQQQIADFRKLVGDQQAQIKNLQDKMQEQIQADSIAAAQGRFAAHRQGLQQGSGIGVVASLVLYAFISAVRKLTGRADVDKPQAQAASAAS